MTPTTIDLEGRLQSGLGEGAAFTQLDWAAREFRHKLGFTPFPGTLNLSLKGHAWTTARSILQQAAGIPIVPQNGYCAAKCFAIKINDQIEGAAVLPEISDYPTDKFELLAPVGIRKELGLLDGDMVRLRVEIK